MDNLWYRSFICHTNFQLRDGKGDTVDKRVNHAIAKEGTFSSIKTYDSFNVYRFLGLVIDFVHKWLPIHSSFVLVQISLPSLFVMC